MSNNFLFWRPESVGGPSPTHADVSWTGELDCERCGKRFHYKVARTVPVGQRVIRVEGLGCTYCDASYTIELESPCR